MIRFFPLILLAMTTAALAEERPVLPLYRLNVELVEQADPQTSSSQTLKRNFEMLVEANSPGKINASVRVPYVSGLPDNPRVHTVALGSIVECMPRESERGVRVDCSVESSYVAPNSYHPGTPPGFPPQMHSRQTRSIAVIPFEKRTLLSAFDDPTSQHHIDVFITARKVAN